MPVIPGKNLEVSIDGDRIKKLKGLEVSIFNFSDKDYEKIPIFIELIPKEGESFSLVAEEAVGAGGIPEAVEQKKVTQSKTLGALRSGYSIKTVNRSDGPRDPEFTATYLLTGDIPSAKVEINKKGVEVRELSYFSYSGNETVAEKVLKILIPIGVVVGVTLLYGLLIYALVRMLKGQKKKQDEKFQQWLEGKFKTDDLKQYLFDGDLISEKKLSVYYIKVRKQYLWETTKPEFMKALLALEKPDEG